MRRLRPSHAGKEALAIEGKEFLRCLTFKVQDRQTLRKGNAAYTKELKSGVI